ncbi:MAG: hypothetical protein R3316_08960 [Rhodovibrionaceae bacterium]|nr:hypothetical protein [Rhodovibrionaceae bacterium]
MLAVLPFKAGTGMDPDDIFAQGLVEDLSGELSRFPMFEVIAPTSCMAVRDLAETEAAARLGATHIVRGRIERGNGQLRLTVGLVKGENGAHLWNERFEHSDDAVFELQHDVVCRIAATLAARLEGTALQEAYRKPAGSLAAYELTLKGLALLREGSVEADQEARALFDRAIKLDSQYGRAYAGLSLSWFNEWSCQFWSQFRKNGQLAYEHAHRALKLDDGDAMLNLVIGRVLLYYREFERASWYLDRALALCPNDAELLIQLSICDAFLGRPETGIEHVEKAMRLNPYYPNYYNTYAIFPFFAARDFDRVIQLCERVVGIPIVDIPVHKAIALAHNGRPDEAYRQKALYHEEFVKRVTYGRPPAKGEPLQWLLDINPYRRQEDIDFLAESFKKLDSGRNYAHGTASAPPSAPNTDSAIIRKRGEGWHVIYAGRETVLPDLKGLRDIVRLLASPGGEFHCLDLAERRDDSFAGDALLDDKARQDMKARIRDLQEDLAEAEDMNDAGRADKLRAELDQLIEQLAKALGLGGRGRRLGNLAERARTTVTWRIRHAIRRVAREHPQLGRHLANSVRTGTFCRYQPEDSVVWEIRE